MSHRKTKSQKKKLKEKKKNLNRFSKSSLIYNNLFEVLELKENLKTLPVNFIKNSFKINVKLDIIFDDNISSSTQSELSDKIHYLIEKPIDIGENKISFNDFIYLIHMRDLFFFVKKDIDKTNFSNLAKKNIIIIFEKLNEFFKNNREKFSSQIVSSICVLLFEEYNPDKGYYPIFHFPNKKDKRLYFEIKKYEIQSEKIEISDGERVVYPCFGWDNNEFKRVIVKKEILDNYCDLPIYVQEHAIQRLFERLSFLPKGFLYENLCSSIMFPKNSGKDKDSYLLDYNYFGKKLGYLLVYKSKDFAVIRSFKFITMSGTPEYNKLKNKLAINKDDIAYLQLDRPETYLNTDIFTKKNLVEIFKECGVGHLLNFAKKNNEIKYECADELEKYFQLS